MTPLQGAAAGLSAGGLVGALLGWFLQANFAVDPCTLAAPCGLESLQPGGAATLWSTTFLQLVGSFAAVGGVAGFVLERLVRKGA